MTEKLITDVSPSATRVGSTPQVTADAESGDPFPDPRGLDGSSTVPCPPAGTVRERSRRAAVGWSARVVLI